jgi:hypothetical protein
MAIVLHTINEKNASEGAVMSILNNKFDAHKAFDIKGKQKGYMLLF